MKLQAISNEIREKIVIHKKNNVAEKDISKWLLISKSSVTKIWALFKKTGDWIPKEATQGRKKAFSDEVEMRVLAKIDEQPDITINELIALFELNISESGLSKKLCKLGYSFKKRQLIRRNRTEKMSKPSENNGQK
jgi:transposase